MQPLRVLFPLFLAALPFALAEDAASSSASSSSVVDTATASGEAAATETPKREVPKEVTYETTYLPPDCTVKSKQYDLLRVTYMGRLWSTGTKFDGNLDRDAPYAFTLGIGQVMAGWEEGMKGMCEGEKRSITIPSDKGYGAKGLGYVIPSHAPLVYDVELVKLVSRNPMPKGPPETTEKAKEEVKEEAPKEEKAQDKVKDEL